MDLQQILNMLLRSNSKWAKKLESITGQPVDHSIKCFNEFLEQLNKGPGLKKTEDKAAEFNANYQMVMGLGFQDHEAQILAADMSGFSLAEITQHFRLHLHWDTNIDEVQRIHDELMPRFKAIGKRAGIFKDDKPDEGPAIPIVNKTNTNLDNGELCEPPWKTKQQPISTNTK